ncbi:sulfite exporter TauE/SafE family protein [Tautonia plasticadhaerens]|uniref:Probable membrane transporter protein n=1 Tax=Tautonia plasticadhaerens TaxID=2527974 RepID=A0A518H8C2_9BACT|nr:sulfite exporter TauE/SafE family protein [Tautonia plasticadhaerens]QDV37061.1 Sulfite exporter TauE/SafE [Tautonia plasticadhaerens]
MDRDLLFGGLALGLFAGVLGGVFGIGGGLVMVPAMILLFSFPIKTATGTSLLAQVLPVGILGVIQYYKLGHVRIGFGLSMALGLLIGIFGGAMIAGLFPAPVMKRLYGIFLISCGAYFLLAPAGVTPRPKALPVEAEAPGRPGELPPDQEVQ